MGCRIGSTDVTLLCVNVSGGASVEENSDEKKKNAPQNPEVTRTHASLGLACAFTLHHHIVTITLASITDTTISVSIRQS